MSVFEKFTNCYSLDKTLKFELKPYIPDDLSEEGKKAYLENFWNKYLGGEVYENDKNRNESYLIVKEILDIFHRRFIKDALKSFKCENNTWDDLYELYVQDKKSKAYTNMQEAIRKDIVKHFNEHSWWGIVSSCPSMLEQEIPQLIQTDDDFKEEVRERIHIDSETALMHLKRFKRFSVYFGKYKENRDNMYKSDDQGTAIANRIVNENFPKFADNISVYKLLKENCKQQLDEIEANLSDKLENKTFDQVFSASYFNSCLTQQGIENYNWLLGANPNENVLGVNSVGNEFLQHHPDSPLKLKDLRMSMLYKQILSDREQIAYMPEQFANGRNGELQLIEAIESFHYRVSEQCLLEKVGNVFSQIAGDDVDLNHVYVVGNNITTLSKMLYGSWNVLGDALRNEFVTGTSKKIKQELAKDITEWVETKHYSLADIIKVEPKILGEHTMKLKDFIKNLSIFRWNEEIKQWSKVELPKQCQNAYSNSFSLVKKICKDGIEISSDDNCKELIKEYLDTYMDLLHACGLFRLGKKHSLLDKDSIYTEYDLLFESFDDEACTLSDIIPLYNKVRSFLTRKASDEGKMLLKFDSPTRANGWNDCSIFTKANHYYLVLYINNLTTEEKEKLMGESTCSFLAYNQQKVNFQNNPRLFIFSKGNNEAPAVAKYKLPIETIKEDYLRCRDLGSAKAKKDYIESHPDFTHRLIDYYKIGLLRHESFKPYWHTYEHTWRPTSEYDSLKDFYEHTQSLTYSIEKLPASFETLLDLQNQGKLFVFEIYNKDFAVGAHGNPNMHTLYWKELFAERNLSDVVYKLSSQGVEFFYRRKQIASPFTHRKSSVLVNKTYADGTPVTPEDYKAFVKYFNREEIELSEEQVKRLPQLKTNRAKIDIIKDKRYTEHKFMLHVPITINFKSNTQLSNIGAFNKYTISALREHKEEINIMGIDRGERNLIYVSVINQKGENIIPPRHYNIIETPTYDGESRKFNYLEKLKQIEVDRDKARKNWTTIGNIKELKNGYLSQVVHEISKLVVQYNAIVVLEDLNYGFKRGRFNVERQVYQNFEKMLIQKLNFLAFKKDSPSELYGNINNGLQLTAPFTSFRDLGKQSGWLFYVPAEYTSKIDAETGFVNLFNMKKAASGPVGFFKEFISIGYRNGLFYFSFDYGNEKLATVKNDYQGKWTLSSHGKRIVMVKNVESQRMESKYVDLTEEIKGVFNGKIALNDVNIDNIINHSESDKICKDLFCKFKLMLQMRNSMPNDGTVDYLISPVASENPFKTGKDNPMGINDADANGAYHIALKGLYLLENDFPQEQGHLQRISTYDWLRFVQTHAYREKK